METTKYLLRDRDQIYGGKFRNRVEVMNINEVLRTAGSPWQRAWADRLGSTPRRLYLPRERESQPGGIKQIVIFPSRCRSA